MNHDHPQNSADNQQFYYDSFLNDHKSWRNQLQIIRQKPQTTTPAGLLLWFQQLYKKVIYGLNSFECQQTIKECGCVRKRHISKSCSRSGERCISCINGTPPYLSTLLLLTVLFGNAQSSTIANCRTERFTVLEHFRESCILHVLKAPLLKLFRIFQRFFFSTKIAIFMHSILSPPHQKQILHQLAARLEVDFQLYQIIAVQAIKAIVADV